MSLVLARIAAAHRNIMPPVDPDWTDVVSLLHFDGAVGSSTITDEKGRTWSTTITPSIASDAGAIGGLSGRFAGGAYVENTAKADWTFLHNGTSFTFEGFIKLDAIGGVQTIFTNNALSSSNYGMGVWIDAAGALQLLVTRGVFSSPVLSASIATASPAGVRTHLAIQYDASTNLYKIFRNGVQGYSGAPVQAFATTAPLDALRIARASSGSNAYALTGNFDEWRFVKGLARYSGNFVPPTSAYPNS